MKVSLFEGVDEISIETVKEYIEGDYSEAFEKAKNKHLIYKGFTTDLPPYGFVTPLKDRKSANTVNYYTLWINNNEAWKDYPKRSIICSSSENTASSYSNNHTTYILLPKNGTNIGISPTSDIWFSTEDNYMFTLHSFNIFLDTFFKSLVEPSQLPNTYQSLVRLLKSIDEKIKNDDDEKKFLFYTFDSLLDTTYSISPQGKRFITETFKDFGIYKLVDMVINPKYNGFTHQTISQFSVSNDYNVELWFDDTAIGIQKDLFEKLL